MSLGFSRRVAGIITMALVAVTLGAVTTPAAAADPGTVPVTFGAATQTEYANAGDSGGSQQPDVPCVSNGNTDVLTGIIGHQYNHDYLAGVTAVCAPLSLDSAGGAHLGGSYQGGAILGGDLVSDSVTAECPVGSVVTGMVPRTGSLIDALTLVCRTVGFNGTLGAVQYAPAVGGTGGNLQTEIDCPDGSVATGMVGYAGADVDRLAFTCRPILPPQPLNSSWPTAHELAANDSYSQALTMSGQNLWYKFPVTPGSKVTVALTGLGADEDLALFSDISQAFTALRGTQDLLHLSAEFAPSAFSPSAFSPSAFSPSAFSPSAFSPSAFSPSAFSPSAFSPSAFSPSAFSPSAFSPSAFSPSAFSPAKSVPSAFSPSAFSPDELASPQFADAFSSAQTRSLIGVSANDGTAPESITAETWNNTGYFYVRVAGRNGAVSPQPFTLTVTTGGGPCAGVSLDSFSGTSDQPTAVSGSAAPSTVILTDPARMAGSDSDKAALAQKLTAFAADVNGAIVDVGSSPLVSALQKQADGAAISCPYAENLVAQAIRDIVNGYRTAGAPVQSVVIVGNDHVIPFFRYPDTAGLGPESDYAPPVADATASQASLRSDEVLGQDAYGTQTDIMINGISMPIPDKPVGRLIETPGDITRMLSEYLDGGATITPKATLVSGYDFLASSARAVADDLAAGAPNATNQTLISQPGAASPWTAPQLKSALLDNHHDIVYLAGHFSANSALAADFTTSLITPDIASAPYGRAAPDAFANTLVVSAGCHSGYNIVDGDGIPNVTVGLDWAQAFAEQGATLVAGTGYQYGDTDFLKYSAKLYADFAHELRYGTGAVAVGAALTAAKQQYLSETPTLAGIDQKALLESTLYGLPMTGVDLPSGRLTRTSDAPQITNTSAVSTDPGNTLGLQTAELNLAPTLDSHVAQLTDLSSPSAASVDASWLSGDAGITGSPATPTLPLVSADVTGPAGTVLRGVGFRTGSYTDTSGITPLTGAPATDSSAAHAPFVSSAFFPNQLARPNYFDALAPDGSGSTHLLVTPAQYMSDAPGSLTDIQRSYQKLGYQLFYSGNTATYGNNTPALAGAPSITGVSATPSGDGTSLSLAAHVVGDPSAGIQQVWVTYTGTDGSPWHGSWQSVDLVQDPDDSTLWTATLPLATGQAADHVRFLVQAVNGVGLVGADDNQGSYYTPGSAVTLPATLQPTDLVVSGDHAGVYRTALTATATLTSDGGTPLDNRRISFTVGGSSVSALTDADGVASAKVPLTASPGSYELAASFAGDSTYAASGASQSDVAITPRSATLTLGTNRVNGELTATLTAGDGPVVQQTVVVLAKDNDSGTKAFSLLTDGVGQVHVPASELPPGNPALSAYFAANTPLPTGTVDLRRTTWKPAVSDTVRPVTITLGGVTDGGTFEAGSPAPTCLVQDLFDGTSAATVRLTKVIADPAQPGRGSRTATCSYTDSQKFTSTVSATYTVTDSSDPQLPVVSDLSAEATDPRGAKVDFSAPTATDLLDGSIPATCTPASGSWFPLGDTSVACSATNSVGLTGSTTFTVHVTAPAPTLTVPANIEATATGAQTPVSFAASPVTATDVVDSAAPSLTCNDGTVDPVNGASFPLGTTTVTCTATNSHGKTGSRSFTVTVVDRSTPAVQPPADVVAEATGPQGAAVTFDAATANDVVDPSLPVSCDHQSGATFGIGATTVTCTATNPHNGNEGQATFIVTVRDTTAPTLHLPSPRVEATGPNTAVSFTATATDLVDGSIPVTCDPQSGTRFPVGSTPVSCSATDAHRNSAVGTFEVIVEDTTPPDLTVPADITATATSVRGAVVTYPAAKAGDLVDGAVPASCLPASGTTFSPGDTTVTCTARDSHGNSATEQFTVHLRFAWSGVTSPLVDGGTYEHGSTIPVKFSLTGASSGIGDLSAQLSTTRESSTGVPMPETTAVVGTFRRTGDHYQVNLSTKALPPGRWQLTIDLGDGVRHTVSIVLT